MRLPEREVRQAQNVPGHQRLGEALQCFSRLLQRTCRLPTEVVAPRQLEMCRFRERIQPEREFGMPQRRARDPRRHRAAQLGCEPLDRSAPTRAPASARDGRPRNPSPAPNPPHAITVWALARPSSCVSAATAASFARVSVGFKGRWPHTRVETTYERERRGAGA